MDFKATPFSIIGMPGTGGDNANFIPYLLTRVIYGAIIIYK